MVQLVGFSDLCRCTCAILDCKAEARVFLSGGAAASASADFSPDCAMTDDYTGDDDDGNDDNADAGREQQ